jgi:dipeptidyl aminopeptidase/acylaminoacyl peptidase
MKLERLTRDGKLKTDPVFVKMGDDLTLVYAQQASATLVCLMKMRFPDGTPERLHPDATTSECEPTFTPDGRVYAFVQSKANLNLKLSIRDTKQNKEFSFDPGGGFAGMRKPTILADGSRIAFSIPAATGQEIALVNGEGKERKSLTSIGLNSWPAYSPDGKKIAFGSSRDGDYEIYVMDATGGNLKRLTRSPGMDCRPAWSPDGKRLAFTSNRDGNYEIYVMSAEGTDVRRITKNDERDDYATWHPDGKRLVFVGERSGKSDLYLIELE